MSTFLTLALVGLGLSMMIAALLDRGARAHAWRSIAEERRWNHEQRVDPYRGGVDEFPTVGSTSDGERW